MSTFRKIVKGLGIALVVFIGLALLVPPYEEKDATVEEELDPVLVEDKEVIDDTLGEIENPVPVGESIQKPVTLSDDNGKEYDGRISMLIRDVKRGPEAAEYIETMSKNNDPAPEGYEWAVLNVSLYLVEAQKEEVPYHVLLPFIGYNSNGEQSPYQQANLEYNFGNVEVFKNGRTQGEVPVLVPEGDEEAMVLAKDIEFEVFFALK